jgi:hypothetical protein
MTTNPSLEANLLAAKSCVKEMMKSWSLWNSASTDDQKEPHIANYAAAFTLCKVYIENYLRHLYPIEAKVPQKVARDIKVIVSEMDAIEKVSDRTLKKVIKDIDQLSRDAA